MAEMRQTIFTNWRLYATLTVLVLLCGIIEINISNRERGASYRASQLYAAAGFRIASIVIALLSSIASTVVCARTMDRRAPCICNCSCGAETLVIGALIMSWLIILYFVPFGVLAFFIPQLWISGSTVAVFLQTVAVAKAVPAADERARRVHSYFAGMLVQQTPCLAQTPDEAPEVISMAAPGLAHLVENHVDDGLTASLLVVPSSAAEMV